MPIADDPELRDYLQRVVGIHGRAEITKVVMYDSWRELPWEPEIGPPTPLPQGKAVMIGIRNQAGVLPGDEVFIVLGEASPELLAANVAANIIRARTGFGRRA